jgi:hypothetical protein
MSGHIFSNPEFPIWNYTARIIRFCIAWAQPILRSDPAPEDREESPSAMRIRAYSMQTIFSGRSQFPNFTIVLRVSVEFLVTTAGPPLKKCQAEYCSM